MELGKTCNLEVGIRDAIHIPIVISKVKNFRFNSPKGTREEIENARIEYMKNREALTPGPGDFVKFTDSSLKEVVKASKEEAHGILDPFLDRVDQYGFGTVVVILHPSMMGGKVFHTFEVNIKGRDEENLILIAELENSQVEDSGCANCYVIENRSIIRY